VLWSLCTFLFSTLTATVGLAAIIVVLSVLTGVSIILYYIWLIATGLALVVGGLAVITGNGWQVFGVGILLLIVGAILNGIIQAVVPPVILSAIQQLTLNGSLNSASAFTADRSSLFLDIGLAFGYGFALLAAVFVTDRNEILPSEARHQSVRQISDSTRRRIEKLDTLAPSEYRFPLSESVDEEEATTPLPGSEEPLEQAGAWLDAYETHIKNYKEMRDPTREERHAFHKRASDATHPSRCDSPDCANRMATLFGEIADAYTRYEQTAQSHNLLFHFPIGAILWELSAKESITELDTEHLEDAIADLEAWIDQTENIDTDALAGNGYTSPFHTESNWPRPTDQARYEDATFTAISADDYQEYLESVTRLSTVLSEVTQSVADTDEIVQTLCSILTTADPTRIENGKIVCVRIIETGIDVLECYDTHRPINETELQQIINQQLAEIEAELATLDDLERKDIRGVKHDLNEVKRTIKKSGTTSSERSTQERSNTTAPNRNTSSPSTTANSTPSQSDSSASRTPRHSRFSPTREALIQEIQKLDSPDKPVTSKRMQSSGRFDLYQYSNEFDTWEKALTAAGINTKSRFLEDIARLWRELGTPPTAEDMASDGRYRSSISDEYFNSWNNALDACKAEYNVPATGTSKSTGQKATSSASTDNVEQDGTAAPTRSELFSELQRLETELGRLVKVHDMDDQGKFTQADYRREFGSWGAALQAASIDKEGHLLDELQRLWDLTDSKPTTTEMNERGAYSASMYYSVFESWSTAIQRLKENRDIETSTQPSTEPSTPTDADSEAAGESTGDGQSNGSDILAEIKDEFDEL